jgi:hypothetical protein
MKTIHLFYYYYYYYYYADVLEAQNKQKIRSNRYLRGY